MTAKQVDTVNINSFSFKSIHSVIVTKLKTRCTQNSVIIQYRIDTGSDNAIPYLKKIVP